MNKDIRTKDNNNNNNPDKTADITDWDEIYNEYSKEQRPPFGGPFTDAMTLIDWLKLHYNTPERLNQ